MILLVIDFELTYKVRPRKTSRSDGTDNKELDVDKLVLVDRLRTNAASTSGRTL